jgi:acyl dehydratase
VLEGQSLPGITLGPISRMDFARFSIAVDDPNRVHIEEQVGRDAGFESVIGSGVMVMALMERTVREWAGLDHVRRANGRMQRPLLAWETIVTEASVARVYGDQARALADCAVTLRTSDGHVIASGTYTVELDP